MGITKAAALWWDHVPVQTNGPVAVYADPAPSRDATSKGLLRDHYTYLVAPVAASNPFPIFDGTACGFPDCACDGPPCSLDLRPESGSA